MAWSLYAAWRGGYRFNLSEAGYSLREKLVVLPRVLPFLIIIAGVLYVLYGGIATPSEAAGVGAMFCIPLVVVLYGPALRSWQPRRVLQSVTETPRAAVRVRLNVGSPARCASPLWLHLVTPPV